MRKVTMAIRIPLLTLGFLIPSGPAGATTATEQAFPDLVHRAEVIAVGTVTGIQEQWDPARQAPVTSVTFSQLTVLKGDPGGESLTLEFLGGHLPDGRILAVSGVPSFAIGEKTVVFSAGNHQDFCPLVGIWQGLLRVKFDPQRAVEIVSDHAHRPIIGVQDGTLLKLRPQGATQDALPLSTLIQLIQQEQGRIYGQP
ncbi:MAG TPA: hypothetical protein VGX03_28730 [Candidatus Binatia bacterium]|jgi:hypothetical protein|nr:hypothetical protein [Candidatus Binatia bacterium]